jgi:hypothetical protein
VLDMLVLLQDFMGVFAFDMLVLDTEQFVDTFISDPFMEFSFIFRCHLIIGPFDSGASNLSKLFISFSRLKFAIMNLNK